MDTKRLNGSERAEKDGKTERRTNTVSTRDAPPSPHGRDPGKKNGAPSPVFIGRTSVQTENDEPQPQVVVAFGFLMTNCAPFRSSL
ncbi:hypothetical protein DM47_2042 [Burkholderia mallei]|nr:hypothetical protein DM45_2776 [Burkholderia mallei]KOT18275.1 hypothetical protein DM47_2042 [Burkholderia mallei]